MKPVVRGKKTFKGVLIDPVNMAGNHKSYAGTMHKANLILPLPLVFHVCLSWR